MPGEIFLIKDMIARLVTKIDDKLTSFAKLLKGDFIGVASILNDKPLEGVRGSEKLSVYSLKD